MILNFVIQQIQNYEDLGVKSLLIASIVALSGAVIFLYKSNMALQKEMRDELKQSMELVRTILEKYHQYTDTIKEMFRNGRNS